MHDSGVFTVSDSNTSITRTHAYRLDTQQEEWKKIAVHDVNEMF